MSVERLFSCVPPPPPWFRFVPVAMVALACTTLMLTFGITIARGDEYEAALPFISDSGRDPPQYYIFVAGLCSGAALNALTVFAHAVHFYAEFPTHERRDRASHKIDIYLLAR